MNPYEQNPMEEQGVEPQPSMQEQPIPVAEPAAAPEEPQAQPAPVMPHPGWQNPPAGNGYPMANPYVPVPQPQPVEPPKKKSKGLRIMAAVLAGVMLLIIGISGGYLAANNDSEDKGFFSDNHQDTSPSADDDTLGDPSEFDVYTEEFEGEVYSYEDIVEKVSPSIVNITVYSADGSAGAYASGIIMNAEQGYVLTNDHIYSEIPGAKFLITLQDKTEFKASFVSGDTRSDIAILKIENPKNLKAATFSSSPVKTGERVLAIGQSYGYADTVSEGIVSAANRRVSLSSGSYSEQYIQTTAAINPGNSGGALVNMAGQVVGVTSAKIASQEVEGLGFAIPSEKALSIVANLQKNGVVKGRAKLGITYTAVNTIASETKGIPVGIYVESLDETCDIAQKGVKKGDVITHVAGKEITNSTILLDVIEKSNAGDSIEITVYHASTKKTQTLSVILAESEGGNSYVSQGSKSQTNNQEEEGNNLPDSPYDFFFDGFGD